MWVETLTELAKRGSFLQGSQLRFGVVNGVWSVIDGQHRLNAIAASNTEQEVQVCVDFFANENEQRAAYFRIDRNRRRSTHAVLDAAQVAAKYGVSKTAAASAFKAGVILASNMKVVHASALPAFLRSDDGKFEAIRPWWNEVAAYDDAVTGAKHAIRKALWNATTMAVGLVTIRSNKDEAIKFWGGIAGDDGLKQGDPRKALSDKLVNVHAEYMDQPIIWCAHAWNAWIEKKSIKQISAPEGSKLRIIGTSYRGTK